jgi:hypothetical protein
MSNYVPTEAEIDRLEKAAWDADADRALVWYRDQRDELLAACKVRVEKWRAQFPASAQHDADVYYLMKEKRDLQRQRDALLEAAKAVVWWNERVGAMCEPEDERDVLRPLLDAIAKAEGN